MSVRFLSPLLAAALFACAPDQPTALVRIDDAAGDDCPTGGVAMSTGLDDDGDGTLDDAEIQDSAVVCDGDRGDVGPTGSTGPLGIPGDDGDDGEDGDDGDPGETGDDGEDGEDGASTLVRVDVLGPDDDDPCDHDGLAVHVGLDDGAGALAGDGILDDTEIDDTAYVCNGIDGGGSVLPEIVEGDVDVSNSLDAALLANVHAITGRLDINSTALTTLSLPLLEHVSALELSGASLEEVSFPALTTIDGEFRVSFSSLAALETFDLGALETVGELSLGGYSGEPLAAVFADFGWLGSLQTVSSGIQIRGDGPFPEDLTGLSNLTTIGGVFDVNGDVALHSLAGLTALESAGGLVLELTAVESLGDWEDVEIPGRVSLIDNHALADLGTLARVTSIGGDLRITGNEDVSECDGRAVVRGIGRQAIEGSVVIQDNDGAQGCPCEAETPLSAFTPSLTGLTAIAFDGQCLWGLTPATNQIHRMDFTGAVLDDIPAPAGSKGLAMAQGGLWVGSATTGTLTRLDWTGTAVDTVTGLPTTGPVALGGDARYLVGLWPADPTYWFVDFEVEVIEPTSVGSPYTSSVAIAPTNDDDMWMAEPDGDVNPLIIGNGGLTGSGFAMGIPTAGIAFDGASLWVLRPDGQIVRFP